MSRLQQRSAGVSRPVTEGRTAAGVALWARSAEREYAMRLGRPLWEAGVAAAPPFSP